MTKAHFHFKKSGANTDEWLQPAHCPMDSILKPALRIIVYLFLQSTIQFLLPFSPRDLATILARLKDLPLLSLLSWQNEHIFQLTLALQLQHSHTRNFLVPGTPLPSG